MGEVAYTGRTVDLLIFQGVKASGDQEITLGWDGGGQVCTGVQKVAQQWATLFLTDRGTVLGKSNRGTDFLRAVRTGRIQVDEDIPAQFSTAAERVRITMELDADGEELEDDEILDEAELLEYSIDRVAALLYLKVRITTRAGEARPIIIPVSLAIV